MEVIQKPLSSNKLNLTLQNDVIEILRKEAESNNISLSALVNKILFKTAFMDKNMNLLSGMTISNDLFMKMIDKMADSDLSEIAKDMPRTIRKSFKSSGFEYDLDHLIYSYFALVDQYCGWYEFSHKVSKNMYKLNFTSFANQNWLKFLQISVRTVLESLKLKIDNETLNENSIGFEFSVPKGIV